eukprot:5356422-Pyramimonas_sp.AAC.1
MTWKARGEAALDAATTSIDAPATAAQAPFARKGRKLGGPRGGSRGSPAECGNIAGTLASDHPSKWRC